jgi:hypothetical protein
MLYLQNYFRGVFLMNGLSQHPIISRFCRLYYIYESVEAALNAPGDAALELLK